MKAIFKCLITVAFSSLILNVTQAQVTSADNLPTSGNYVGFNNNSIITLPIRNDGDPRIHISSNLRLKFAINELATWNGLKDAYWKR